MSERRQPEDQAKDNQQDCLVALSALVFLATTEANLQAANLVGVLLRQDSGDARKSTSRTGDV